LGCHSGYGRLGNHSGSGHQSGWYICRHHSGRNYYSEWYIGLVVTVGAVMVITVGTVVRAGAWWGRLSVQGE